MTSFSFRLAGALLGLAGLSLAACGVTDPKDAVAAAQGPGAWQAAQAKHGGADVALSYRLLDTPNVGVPVRIQLQFGAAGSAGATAHWSVADGLQLTSALDTLTLGNSQTLHEVTVVPTRNGLSYLHVFIAQADRRSAISVPVPTGDTAKALPADQNLKTTPSGEKVLVLPAQ